jgi:hypothetical protein
LSSVTARTIALRVVVESLALVALALDHPEVLELLYEPTVGTRVVEDLVQPVEGARAAQGKGGAPQRTGVSALRLGDVAVGSAGGELLADHPQRQKFIALQAQDRAKAVDVGRRVQPVASGRPPRREQLLVLEVADLRD